MKAVQIFTHGGPDVVEWVDIPDPVLGPGDVRIDIRASAVNHLDMWVRRGMPGKTFPFPHTLGSEGMGYIVEVGSKVSGFKVGDRVIINPGVSCGHCERCYLGDDNLCVHYGVFAEPYPGVAREQVVLPVRNVEQCPEQLDDLQAASFAIAYMTSWQMLVDRARIAPGDHVLIQAAGSGIGTAAIQICKLFGAKVIALSSSPSKVARALELGADHSLCTQGLHFQKAMEDLTHGRGLDVVFEHIGKTVWSDCLIALRRGGTLVTCGATSGYMAETDLRYIFAHQLNVLGSTMARHGVFTKLLSLAADGKLKPIIGHTMPMSEAADAHALLEKRGVFGKLVLTR